MKYPIEIVRVKSRNTGKIYCIAYPSADVDYVTEGLIILVSTERDEIQLHDADKDEYNMGPHEAGVIRAKKENEKQNRIDLRAVGIDLNTPSKIWRAVGSYAYHDIHDESGHADAIKLIGVENFLKSGGIILDKR